MDEKGHLTIDQAKIRTAERLDGKFADDTLTAEDLALGYKQLQRGSSSSLKSRLRMRPVFHWVVHHIHAHVAITVLGLLLEKHAARRTAPFAQFPDGSCGSEGAAQPLGIIHFQPRPGAEFAPIAIAGTRWAGTPFVRKIPLRSATYKEGNVPIPFGWRFTRRGTTAMKKGV